MARPSYPHRIHVPIRTSMKARLEKLARDTDLPVAHHTRRALAEYLERAGAQTPEERHTHDTAA